MQKPTIHLNGTPASRLSEAYYAAANAIQDALTALGKAHPNARDYYVQGADAYSKADTEQEERYDKLRSVYTDMVALADHVESQARR